MKKKNKITKIIRYFMLSLIIVIGMVSIIGSGDDDETAGVYISFAYVANDSDDNISQYTIGTDGVLTAMTTPTVSAGNGPQSITVDPSGSYVYVANYIDGTVSQYMIGVDGALTAMTTPTVLAGNGPQSVVTTGYLE